MCTCIFPVITWANNYCYVKIEVIRAAPLKLIPWLNSPSFAATAAATASPVDLIHYTGQWYNLFLSQTKLRGFVHCWFSVEWGGSRRGCVEDVVYKSHSHSSIITGQTTDWLCVRGWVVVIESCQVPSPVNPIESAFLLQDVLWCVRLQVEEEKGGGRNESDTNSQ